MDTKQKRTAPGAKRQPGKAAPPKKRPAPKAAARRNLSRHQSEPVDLQQERARQRAAAKATDKEKRAQAARAARLKAMKKSVDAKQAKANQTKRKVRKPRRPMQPVIYTQPRVFNRRKLVIQLMSILAVVLAMILCLSIFFRVEVIEVAGAHVYSNWAVREASGIEEGDYLLTFSKAKAGAKIRANLPYVESVRFGIKLPNTVIIDIVEADVVYAVQAQDSTWWLITSGGRVVEQCENGLVGNYTQVLGVYLNAPVVGGEAFAFEDGKTAEQETTPDGEDPDAPTAPVPVTVTARERLTAALMILTELENNGIVGEAASIHVGNLQKIELKYGTKYQVNLGDVNKMDYKIAAMVAAIKDPRMKNSMGVLDVSFTTWPDRVGYTPLD